MHSGAVGFCTVGYCQALWIDFGPVFWSLPVWMISKSPTIVCSALCRSPRDTISEVCMGWESPSYEAEGHPSGKRDTGQSQKLRLSVRDIDQALQGRMGP